jgi:uncharacterized membrane protein YeaQ/YmgE (transglycosylase-associated protein family)
MNMEQILINLIAGALGGVGAGKASPNFDLGTIGNIISGLVGGGVLGQIVTALVPSVVAAAQSGNQYLQRLSARSKAKSLPDDRGQCGHIVLFLDQTNLPRHVTAIGAFLRDIIIRLI